MTILKIGKLSVEWRGVSKRYMEKMILKSTEPSDNSTRVNRIPAIKWHRQYVLDCTGKTPSLKESKFYVENVLSKHNISWNL